MPALAKALNEITPGKSLEKLKENIVPKKLFDEGL